MGLGIYGKNGLKDSNQVQIKIEKLVYGGAGMTRTEDEGVVFVGKVLPGELVEVEVVDKKKDYANARLVKAPASGEDRMG
jgi:23S rRNA (uracil1939-C5)-methyltransferase